MHDVLANRLVAIGQARAVASHVEQRAKVHLLAIDARLAQRVAAGLKRTWIGRGMARHATQSLTGRKSV
jgi:hypothetical protein